MTPRRARENAGPELPQDEQKHARGGSNRTQSCLERPSAGSACREQSLVARAAREGKGVTVNDVTQAPDFLPNPLLPNTRSELAVPMIAGGNVIGVFDIQSEEVSRFTDTDINIQTTLAAQLATSIQNVRSFEQVAETGTIRVTGQCHRSKDTASNVHRRNLEDWHS